MSMTTNYIKGVLPYKRYASFFFIPDLHWPFNLFFDSYLDMLSNNPPDYLILGGDNVDNSPFNHWAKRVPKSFKVMPQPREYYADANEKFFARLRLAVGKKTKIIAILGNHEEWSVKAIADNPEGEGYWEVENNISSQYIDGWVLYRKTISLGEMSFAHGDGIPYTGSQPSKKMASKWMRTIMFGHYHGYEVSSLVTPIDMQPLMGISVPASTEVHTCSYGEGMPHNRSNGFAWGWIKDNGNALWQVTVIRNGEYHFNGRLYKSKQVEPIKLAYAM